MSDTENAACASFPRARLYEAMRLARCRRVRESLAAGGPFAYTERHLQCLWYDDRLRPPALCTSGGEVVRVERAGRWNLESGPDFLDAVLLIGPDQRRLQGDVEIHVRPSDWRSHGHAQDCRYARLIAHVSYFAGALPPGALPAGAVQISLREALGAAPAFSFDAIDVTAYPYAVDRAARPPCAEAMARLDPLDRAAVLDAAGEARLRTKSQRMLHAIEEKGPEQALYEEVMCALGYKHNRQPFRSLARRVTVEALRSEGRESAMEAYALLAGVAGLLPSRPSPRWNPQTRNFVRHAWDCWWRRRSAWEHRVMPAGCWRVANTRPQNHPLRRLAAACGLFAQNRDLALALEDVSTDDPQAWLRRVSRLLRPDACPEYWVDRAGFSAAPALAPSALIGAHRLSAIIGNVAVPFLAARGRDVAPLLNSLPIEHDNAVIRQTAALLFGADHNPALYRRGLRQQGILQIFHDFCIEDRTACAECPLPLALGAVSAPEPG